MQYKTEEHDTRVLLLRKFPVPHHKKLITCCTADNVFKGSSLKYLLQSIFDNWVLQELGLAIHINNPASFYITPWKDRDLETTWRDFAYEIRYQLDLFFWKLAV